MQEAAQPYYYQQDQEFNGWQSLLLHYKVAKVLKVHKEPKELKA
jgi:hypothetical protein